MRISTNMIYSNLIRNLAKATERTQVIQEVISTGRTINRHSDDPFGSSLVVRYQSDLAKFSQYGKSFMQANSWLSMTDSLVLDMQNLLHESKNIALAQASSTVSSEVRTQAAIEVKEFYKQLINFGNTKLGGSYIFGGSLTNTAPFNANGTYNGNGDDYLIEIQEGVAVKVNFAGSEFLVTDLNPDLSAAAATAGSTSSTGLVARNINSILASPNGLAENKVTFVLTNGLTEEATYTTDSDPTRAELGVGIADAVNNHDTLNQYIRASYDSVTGNITFEAKETGTEGNQYTIDAANTTSFGGTVDTTFAGGRSEITSGFVFDATNSDMVFAENGGADITANIITDGGAVSEQVYTGDQVASFIKQAMESQSNNTHTYTVSYDETTNFYTIVNDAGNSGGAGTLNLRWGLAGTTAEQTLGFNSVDSGAFAAGVSDISNNQVEFNVLNNVNDKFRLTIDGTPSAADIDITAGVYTSTTLAAEMQTQIINDASFAAGITVDFGTTITGQFTINSSTTGTSSTVTLTSDASDDFLVTAGLNRDFEVSGTSPTPLADLNGGAGVTLGSITITDRSGSSAVINLAAAVTIADVIDTINLAAVNVTAQLNSEGNGIDIIDNNGFPTQNLVITDNATARDLGLVGNKPGVIYGTDLTPSLTDATRVNVLDGGNGLTLSAVRVTNGLQNEKVDLSRANSITDILTALNGLGINTAAAINSSKTALDVNSTSSQTAAIVSEVDGGTTSSDLGIQGANDFLKTLAVLEEALEKDDRYALLNMLDQFDLVLNKLVEKGSGAGARSNQIDAMNNLTKNREVAIADRKSDIEDADMIEYLTKFTLQQTALQAMMAVAGRSVQLSLLDFLR